MATDHTHRIYFFETAKPEHLEEVVNYLLQLIALWLFGSVLKPLKFAFGTIRDPW